jgi:hypothetical protein
MLKSEFVIAGVFKAQDIIPFGSLEQLRATMHDVLKKEVKRSSANLDASDAFASYAALGSMHQKFIWSAKHAPSALTRSINTIMHTASFFSIACDQRLLEQASKLLFGRDDSVAQLAVTELNFRVDLPAEFKAEEKRFSLVWHQESGYFTDYVSHDEGLVLWIPIFDTGKSEGAIQVVPGSHRDGRLEHETVFMDPINNRNKRQFISDRLLANFEPPVAVESKAGDAVFMDFNLIHATGKNVNPENVRCTIQARVSNLNASDFASVS